MQQTQALESFDMISLIKDCKRPHEELQSLHCLDAKHLIKQGTTLL